MKKNVIKTFLAAAIVATTVLTTGITTQAAEATAAATTETQATKVLLTSDSISALKAVFDAKYYAETYPDIVTVLGNDESVLFNHYITNGIYEGRDASVSFNVSFYSLANADVTAIYGEDLNGYISHYVNYGIKENRIASAQAFSTASPAAQQVVLAAIDSVSNSASATNVATATSSVINTPATYLAKMKQAQDSALNGATKGGLLEQTIIADYNRAAWADFFVEHGMSTMAEGTVFGRTGFTGAVGEKFGVAHTGSDGKEYVTYYTMGENQQITKTNTESYSDLESRIAKKQSDMEFITRREAETAAYYAAKNANSSSSSSSSSSSISESSTSSDSDEE
ncbi:hypothetical protein SAMN04487830_10522 [Pseudobutyrivibrio sp. OR37]|uniref:hypothetical protein n=1 Tax=Pseudobutyrivibrio sp. OR37 TaxID=1798186 RepID=UPI0008E53083|nr:hypothetical protein [Pseudobutyrivibrio sp. OR37]SFH68416.1 hypothetical protein SAMN04487830_10522 [Pseudobutyrivibrio sp. OR37]